MDSNSNSNSPKRNPLLARVLGGLFIVAGALAVYGVLNEWWLPINLQPRDTSVARIARNLIAAAFLLTLVSFVARLVIRRTSWRTRRRMIVTAAIVATLIAALYAVENIRGRRAWAAFKKDLEAHGATLDWEKFVSPPVPSEQNVFAAPKMSEWFIRHRTTSPKPATSNEWNTIAIALGNLRTNVVVSLMVVGPNANVPPESADLVIQYDVPPAANREARQQLAELVASAVVATPDANTIRRLSLPSGGELTAAPLFQVHPRRVVMRAQKVPTTNDLNTIFSPLPLPSDAGRLRVQSVGNDAFEVVLNAGGVISAEEYLRWSDPLRGRFDTIRAALQRPYVRMEGDYDLPYQMPLPDFVACRNVAQILSARARAFLLTDQPEDALRELTLVHDMCRLLEGKPVMLVAAMINVAIHGLYVDTVAEGIKMRAWMEPQLATLQKQLEQSELPLQVAAALDRERAASCRAYETMPATEWGRLAFGDPQASSLQLLRHREYCFYALAPRGWIYQNITTFAGHCGQAIAAYDPNGRIIRAHQTEQVLVEMQKKMDRFAPYSLLAGRAAPNYMKAWQTTARNQTSVNEAAIACALERYRLAHGRYPDTLDSLTPQFAKGIPHDLLGGAPLHYRTLANDQFLLYSIGWNEKDDGGIPAPKTQTDQTAKGDWVWPAAGN